MARSGVRQRVAYMCASGSYQPCPLELPSLGLEGEDEQRRRQQRDREVAQVPVAREPPRRRLLKQPPEAVHSQSGEEEGQEGQERRGVVLG